MIYLRELKWLSLAIETDGLFNFFLYVLDGG